MFTMFAFRARAAAPVRLLALAISLLLPILPGVATAAPCVGDCSGDGAITVDEILLGVNIALGLTPLSACAPFDADVSGTLTVDELVSAVDGALRGCEAVVPTPTPAPRGPRITSLSIARADLSPVTPFDVDEAGREIYRSLSGTGIWIIVEAATGPNGLVPGSLVFASAPIDPTDRPDIQVIVSRDLGDGNPVVCDTSDGHFGGVPAAVPFTFSEDQRITDVINEMSCRIDGGSRTRSGDACTQDPSGQGFGFAFVNAGTQIQFCVSPSAAWRFPVGETVVAARVRDRFGEPGEVREMVVRVAQ